LPHSAIRIDINVRAAKLRGAGNVTVRDTRQRAVDLAGKGVKKVAKTRRIKAAKTVPHSLGFRPGIDLNKLGQLDDALEAEAYARRTRTRGQSAEG
jgi:hypothetical protein